MIIEKLTSEDKSQIKDFCSKIKTPFDDLGKLDYD